MQVVGVGTKSLAEAAHHNTFDLSTLGTWQAGKPVPFAFLADAFEAIAQVRRCTAATAITRAGNVQGPLVDKATSYA